MVSTAEAELTVTGYIHEIEKSFTNKSLLYQVPIDIYHLCINYYIIDKYLFIKYKSKHEDCMDSTLNETRFAIINTKTKYISKHIIVHNPTNDGRRYLIRNKSLCFIPNISDHLCNLPPSFIQKLKMNFNTKRYDGFFCIITIEKTPNTGSGWSYFPALIIYESTDIYHEYNQYDINAKVLLSKVPAYDQYSRCISFCRLNTWSSIIYANPSCEYIQHHDEEQLSVLNIHGLDLSEITSDSFKFKNKTFDTLSSKLLKTPTMVSYQETLNQLLHGTACIGVYDENLKQWKSAIYMNHWDETKRIMIKFIDTNKCGNRLKTLKHFPVENIRLYGYTTPDLEVLLEDVSGLTQKQMDERRKKGHDIIKRKEYKLLFDTNAINMDDRHKVFQLIQLNILSKYFYGEYVSCYTQKFICFLRKNVLCIYDYESNVISDIKTNDQYMRPCIDCGARHSHCYFCGTIRYLQSVFWFDCIKKNTLYTAYKNDGRNGGEIHIYHFNGGDEDKWILLETIKIEDSDCVGIHVLFQ